MNFPVSSVRRVFRIVNGGTPASDQRNWDGEVSWATPVDLAKCDGSKISDTQRSITIAGLHSGSNSVPEGSLIVSSRAPIGYIAETTGVMAFNQGCKGLVPTRKVDIRFFRYQLSTMVEQLQSYGQGSTFSELSADYLATIPIVVPSLFQQQHIADYLDIETARIDSLITKKRQLIELCTMRIRCQAIMLTTKGGHSIPLRRFLGRIKTGTTPPETELSELLGSDVAWFSPGDMGPYLEMKEPARMLSGRAIVDGWSPLFPADATLIIGIGATAGRVGHNTHKSTGNQQITCLSGNGRVLPKFLSWQLWGRSDEIHEIAPYTTLPILNNEFLRSLPFYAPPLEAQQNIVEKTRQNG